MQITVTFRHVDPTPALRTYAEDKVAKVARKYLRRPGDAHVILGVSKERHVAEITLQAQHVSMFAKETTHDLYSAIDLAVEKLEHQAQKLKARRSDRKGADTPRAGGAASDGVERAEAPRPVIETRRVPAMSIDDAIGAARALRRGVLPLHQRSRPATRRAVSSPRRALRPDPGRGAAGTRRMKIEDILTEDLVIPALGARSKTDALVELATAVARRHPELERERLVQALEDRERLNSTALGDGVAIPHGKLPGIKRVFAAFARSPQGVDFQSLDGRPTHLFFLLVAPEDSAGAHLKALARISRLLKNEEFRTRLMQATSARALWDTIREEDARY